MTITTMPVFSSYNKPRDNFSNRIEADETCAEFIIFQVQIAYYFHHTVDLILCHFIGVFFFVSLSL